MVDDDVWLEGDSGFGGMSVILLEIFLGRCLGEDVFSRMREWYVSR